MTYTLHTGDCLDVMRTLPDCSVDTVITDPPAGIAFMGKDWDKDKGGRDAWVAWLTEIMTECLRVLKPGGMALVWSIPRTSHWTGTAIESAGFEVRDVITHIFGSGFPKSLDISKAIDNAAGAEREIVGLKTYADGQTYNGGERSGRASGIQGNRVSRGPMMETAPATPDAATWHGYGTALKPAAEFWWLAMKPLDGTYASNALKHQVAGLWIDGGRIGTETRTNSSAPKAERNGFIKGFVEGTKTEQHPSGRWPANLILDGSDEVTACFPVSTVSGTAKLGKANKAGASIFGSCERGHESYLPNDTGSAARFFATCPPDDGDEFTRLYYTAKASRRERNQGLEGMEAKIYNDGRDEDLDSGRFPANRGNEPKVNGHPTVKPLSLLRYLVRLTRTPFGGTVLDPFMGSGTTGVACVYEGRDFIGIDMNAEYVEIARRRIEHAEKEAAKVQPTLLAADNA